MTYLWLKAMHVVFMVTWFAGLFYLPRLFVYHAQEATKLSHELFKVMERRLFIIMTIGAIATVVAGLWILLINWSMLLQTHAWMQVKLILVLLLIAYHFYCWKLLRAFRDNNNRHTEQWYRWFNEIPAIFLLSIIVLIIVRPF